MLMYFYFQFIRIYILYTVSIYYIIFTTVFLFGGIVLLYSNNKIFKNNIKKNSQLQAGIGLV